MAYCGVDRSHTYQTCYMSYLLSKIDRAGGLAEMLRAQGIEPDEL